MSYADHGGRDVGSGNEPVIDGCTVHGPDGAIDCDRRNEEGHEWRGVLVDDDGAQLRKRKEEEQVLVDVECDAWCPEKVGTENVSGVV